MGCNRSAGVRVHRGVRPAPLALVAAALLAAVVAAPAPAGAGRDRGAVTAVHIVSRVGEGGVADDRPKRARADAGVTLFAVVVAKVGGETRHYSEAPVIRLGTRRVAARPLAEAPPAALTWYKVEPEVASLSNTASGKFRFEVIPYAATLVPAWVGKGSVAADVTPTLTPDHGGGLGTMRYQLRAFTADGERATPGTADRAGRGAGGLSDRVHRISLRKDDTLLGVLTELYGQPYIWASAGTSDARHQSERLEGSDCADFVVYGWRRLGVRLAYTWTGDLPRHTRLLARGTAGEDGVYRDREGRAIRFPTPGDIALFPRHVGVLTVDRGVPGVLDHADLLMHSYFDTPREQPLGDTDYAATWLEVRRLPASLAAAPD
jgi:hypothetical protein